jgi:hypothetical protein
MAARPAPRNADPGEFVAVRAVPGGDDDRRAEQRATAAEGRYAVDFINNFIAMR